jgi:hypothetical protein
LATLPTGSPRHNLFPINEIKSLSAGRIGLPASDFLRKMFLLDCCGEMAEWLKAMVC